MPIYPTLIEELLSRISKKYASESRRLEQEARESGAEKPNKPDYKNIRIQVLRGCRITDPSDLSNILSQISKLQAEKRREKAGGQMKLRLRSPRRTQKKG